MAVFIDYIVIWFTFSYVCILNLVDSNLEIAT